MTEGGITEIEVNDNGYCTTYLWLGADAIYVKTVDSIGCKNYIDIMHYSADTRNKLLDKVKI